LGLAQNQRQLVGHILIDFVQVLILTLNILPPLSEKLSPQGLLSLQFGRTQHHRLALGEPS
jgi:hypothetical protein